MKIWIDLTNSPHVNFFAGMINELQRNHDVLLTCRPLANTIDLLQLHKFRFHIVGRHYGQSKLKKITGFPVRLWQLYQFLKDEHIDVAISHSSFYSPAVSRLLGVRCIYLNDNEHAAGNRISFLFADHIMIPEFLHKKKIIKQGAREYKIIKYPGVKEGVYLWNYRSGTSKSRDTIDLPEGDQAIFIRPEPWSAQYYKGEKNFIDSLLLELKNNFKIFLLPRGDEQKAYYRQEQFSAITVLEKSIGLADIMENCTVFIGAGGTMTREAAVLGVPTISIYQGELLDVDRYLLDSGVMVYNKKLTAAYVQDFITTVKKTPADKQLMLKGREAYLLIMKTLLHEAPTLTGVSE